MDLFHTGSSSDTLPDSTLVEVVKDISPHDLDYIAVEHMGIKHHEIQDISASVREQIDMRKYQILELWRNRYTGPDARAALLEILTKARKDGLISDEAYQPLTEKKTGKPECSSTNDK